MLAKKSTEDDVRMMFAPYGTIEDCTVLRDPNGQSRGESAGECHLSGTRLHEK